MRGRRLLVAAVVLQVCGCSTLIARSGKDLSQFETRDQVHAEFGCPDEDGQTEDESFDTYYTRRKVSEQTRAYCLGMGIVMSFGLGELIAFPWEVYRLGRRTALGQELRFHYDSSGKVSRVLLDGEHLLGFYRGDSAKPGEGNK